MKLLRMLGVSQKDWFVWYMTPLNGAQSSKCPRILHTAPLQTLPVTLGVLLARSIVALVVTRMS